MLLNEPGKTNYDLNFNLFGFGVRVHPAFLILPAVFGAQLATATNLNPGMIIVVFIVVFSFQFWFTSWAMP